ncbi:hypothetical protein [Shinella sp.]|uniref:hypothetical protein n=1 Tax=Shinella sp. TaxID=1870904 RepID=UPI0029BA40F8|nr:hypothetical protein [Shinella sp.]MDX3976985.1 hypothetical protein [Shinella sp.]
MDNTEFPLGMLGQSLLREEDPVEKMAEVAARISAQIGIERQKLRQQAAAGFQALRMRDETRFAQKLYDFAVENNLQFRNGDWWEGALRLAGRKHIDQLADKKKRGRRPVSPRQPAGLLQAANRPPVKGEGDYYEVEAVMQAYIRDGNNCSQIEACRIVARQRGAALPMVIEAKAKAIEKAVGAYRRMQGIPLPLGRPKGMKTKTKRPDKSRKK